MKNIIIILTIIFIILISCDDKISQGIVIYKEYKPKYYTKEYRYDVVLKRFVYKDIQHYAEFSLHVKTNDSIMQKIYVRKDIFDFVKIDEKVIIKENIFGIEIIKYTDETM